MQHARSDPEMAYLVEGCYFDDPIGTAAERFRQSEEWAAISALLQPGKRTRVLEFGAGRGVVSYAFAREGCEVVALEPDTSEVVGSGAIRRLCAETGVSIDVVESTGEVLPFEDGQFDIVVCRAVLHHVRDQASVCRQAWRVLKPGGRFLAIKEHIAESPEELEAFFKIHPLHHLYGGENAYPEAAYLKAIRDAGFKRARTFGSYDSPICSHPDVSTEALRGQFSNRLSRLLPRGAAQRLAANEAAFTLYRRWLSRRDRRPGRVKSFLAFR